MSKIHIEFRLVETLPGDQPVMALDHGGHITYLLNKAHDPETVVAALGVVATANAEFYHLAVPA